MSEIDFARRLAWRHATRCRYGDVLEDFQNERRVSIGMKVDGESFEKVPNKNRQSDIERRIELADTERPPRKAAEKVLGAGKGPAVCRIDAGTSGTGTKTPSGP